MCFTFIVLLFTFNTLIPANSYNIDVSSPIIYADPANFTGKLQRGSYFGYSVILFKGNKNWDPWIQIGAPRAQSQTNKYNESGTVFRCPIGKSCNEFPIDPNASDFEEVIPKAIYTSKKDGAWIGVAMDIHEPSQRVVVCGHRWINNRNFDNQGAYYMLGACFWSKINQNDTEALYPCIDRDKYIMNRKVFVYGQCQAGISIHLSASLKNPNLVIGTPGLLNWQGSTALVKDGSDLPTNANKRSREFEDFSLKIIPDPTNPLKNIHTFSYLGYSVTSGYFFGKEKLYYVAGAPRSNYLFGHVLIYEFPESEKWSIIVKHERIGQTMGEYFGSSLAALDINNDGYDDLIVGASKYSKKCNEGRVYIYYGANDNFQAGKDLIINGQAINGEFGLAIQALGDLDSDGYQDVAISAPYEDELHGVLYIYNGGAMGLSPQPSQRITARSIYPSLLGFGISFSRAVDIDGNHVQDLAIGSYISGHAVLLRSYPVVQLNMTLNSLVPRLNIMQTNFVINVCSLFKCQHLVNHLDMSYTLTFDKELRRVYYKNQNEYNATWHSVLTKHKNKCENITLHIILGKANTLDPIEITVSQYPISETKPGQPIWVRHKVRGPDTFNASKVIVHKKLSILSRTIKIPYLSECPPDKPCMSDLKLKSAFIGLNSSDTFVIGSQAPVQLEVTVYNVGEPAYLTQLEIFLPSKISLTGIPVECDLDIENDHKIICVVGNPLRKDKQKKIVFSLNMDEITYSKQLTKSLEFKLVTSTKSDDKNKDDNVHNLILNLEKRAKLNLQAGSLEKNYYFGNNTHIVTFMQYYQVTKIGESPLEDVSVTIQIPVSLQTPEGIVKFLQIYEPVGIHDSQTIRCSAEESFLIKPDTTMQDSELLDEEIKEDKKVKRSVPEKQEDDIRKTPQANVTLFLNCSSPEVNCLDIQCTTTSFKANNDFASFNLKMILNTTLLAKSLDQKNLIYFTSNGRVVGPGGRHDTAEVSSTIIGDAKIKQVELWIWIVSALAGLLILLLLSVALVKAGFFRRTKKQELQALKEAEVAHEFEIAELPHEAPAQCDHNLIN